MRAVVRDAYGSVDVLRLAEVDKPVAGEGEVLVRVHAAGLDQGVWHLMVGMPYAMRLAGFGVRAPKNRLLGYDLAGRVEAVDTDAGSFRPGDEVFGTCRGSFAEYVARADRLASKPDNVSFEQAAAVPISGYAALLRDPEATCICPCDTSADVRARSLTRAHAFRLDASRRKTGSRRQRYSSARRADRRVVHAQLTTRGAVRMVAAAQTHDATIRRLLSQCSSKRALQRFPEMLLAGRERAFIADYMFASLTTTPDAISPDDVAEFARTYARPGGFMGAAGLYRSLLSEGEDIRGLASRQLEMPLLALVAVLGNSRRSTSATSRPP